VTFVGPTTLTAFLNSLQVGFKTLAISRKGSEAWKVLGHVKYEFGKFGEVLEAVQKKLGEASDKLNDVSRRKEFMEKRLASVEALPEVVPPLGSLCGGSNGLIPDLPLPCVDE
jgi:DNA recombination protein RmuC